MVKTKRIHQAETAIISFFFPDKAWVIIKDEETDDGLFYCSVNNNWTNNIADAKEFTYYHHAYNFAKKRVLKIVHTDRIGYTLSNEELTVTINDIFSKKYDNVKSMKQVSDILKRDFAFVPSKTDELD